MITIELTSKEVAVLLLLLESADASHQRVFEEVRHDVIQALKDGLLREIIYK